MQTAEVLTEDELTPSNLKKFFESIYLKADLTDHDALIVQADDVLPVAITLDQHKKLLKLLFAYENDHGQWALKYVNYMNDTYNLARFTVSSSGKSIGVDYDLPYRGGINGSLGIAVGYPNILWSTNHYYPQEHPHDYPH
jgi:hypothetical protein